MHFKNFSVGMDSNKSVYDLLNIAESILINKYTIT